MKDLGNAILELAGAAFGPEHNGLNLSDGDPTHRTQLIRLPKCVVLSTELTTATGEDTSGLL